MIDRALTPRARAVSDGIKLPRPTLRYRLRAWQTFQRTLDPLAPPLPLLPGAPHGNRRKKVSAP
jgi:hypothetical protein